MVVLATDLLSAYAPIGYTGSRGFTGSSGNAGFTGSMGTVTTSATAPGSPTVGTIWFDNDDGTVYIYYNDGTSSQWVEIGNSNYISKAAGANTQVQYNSSDVLAGSANFTYNGTNLTVASGNIIDSKGDVRDIPLNTIASFSNYTLVASDGGKFISTTSSTITVPPSVFTAGEAVSIYNNTGSFSVIIEQGSGVTIYQAGTSNTGQRLLDMYGVATILCVAANTFVISGAGLT